MKANLCGVLWAADRETAFVRLMRKELHPLSLTRCSLTHRWRPQHCYEMFRQLATLLQAGLTLSQSLQMLAEQHPVKHWQALLENMNDDLSEGCAFSEALKRWPAVFSPLYVSMVKQGANGKAGNVLPPARSAATIPAATHGKSEEGVALSDDHPGAGHSCRSGHGHPVLPEFAAIYKTFNTPCRC